MALFTLTDLQDEAKRWHAEADRTTETGRDHYEAYAATLQQIADEYGSDDANVTAQAIEGVV